MDTRRPEGPSVQGWRSGMSTGAVCSIADKAGRRPCQAGYKQFDIIDRLRRDFFPDEILAREGRPAQQQ